MSRIINELKWRWCSRKYKTFKKAIDWCHVRSSVCLPWGKRYAKNHTEPLESQVPWYLKLIPLWREYDPRDDDDCSLFMYND